MNLDLFLINLINGLAGRWELLDFTGIFFAKYFEYVLVLILVLFLLINRTKYWRMVVESIAAAILTRVFLVEAIRMLWFRPRPFVDQQVNQLMYHSSEASFPSGHAAFWFALSTVVYHHNRKIGIYFYIGSFLIGIARVFVGVHWPSDILAGALLGVVMGLILSKVFRNIKLSKGL